LLSYASFIRNISRPLPNSVTAQTVESMDLIRHFPDHPVDQIKNFETNIL
jgi:hypothetical protein